MCVCVCVCFCVCVCVHIIYNFSLMSKMLDAVEAVHGGVVPAQNQGAQDKDYCLHYHT